MNAFSLKPEKYNFEIIHADETIKNAFERVSKVKKPAYPVVDSRFQFLGMVSFEDLEYAACNCTIGAVAAELERTEVPVVNLDTSIKSIMKQLIEEDPAYFAIVHQGNFVRVLARKDIMKLIIHLIEQKIKDEHFLENFTYKTRLGEIAYLISELGI